MEVTVGTMAITNENKSLTDTMRHCNANCPIPPTSGKFTKFSYRAHQIFTKSSHAAGVMNQDIIKHIIRWSGRLVTLLGYAVILGMIGAGVALMGLALLMALFSREGSAVVLIMSGTLFCGVGTLALLRQLRTQNRELRQQLAAMSATDVTA